MLLLAVNLCSSEIIFIWEMWAPLVAEEHNTRPSASYTCCSYLWSIALPSYGQEKNSCFSGRIVSDGAAGSVLGECHHFFGWISADLESCVSDQHWLIIIPTLDQICVLFPLRKVKKLNSCQKTPHLAYCCVSNLCRETRMENTKPQWSSAFMKTI